MKFDINSLMRPNFCISFLIAVVSFFTAAFQAAKAVAPAALAVPALTSSAPAFAFDSVIEALPTQTLSLEVQFGAYLAILLGTFLPCLFLINLYIQTESRKAGRAGGQDSE